MKNVSGACAFITGGASGIGFGMAQILAEAGAKVVIADINGEAAAAAAAKLNGAGGTACSTPLNVADADSWAAALTFVSAGYGNVQILCNNAGVSGSLSTKVEELPLTAWNWIRSINLDGVLNGIRTLVPHMKAHGQPSHVVNTGSMASLFSSAENSDYSATKYGVAAFSEALRAELKGFDIGVSLLCPGAIKTAIIENSRKAQIENDMASNPAPKNEEIETAIKTGMEPRSVGRLVLRAIQENRSYIFTHPEYKPLIDARFNAISKDFDWASQSIKSGVLDD